MVDYHKGLVSVLNNILPTHYEMTLTSKTKTPCISYMEINNYSETNVLNASIGYSRINYQIKVWGNDIAQLQEYSLQVDEALRTLGFKRISSGEIYDNQSTMIQKIMTFEGLALEEF